MFGPPGLIRLKASRQRRSKADGMNNLKSPRAAVVRENSRKPFGLDIIVREHQVAADEPVAVGGQDSGPDPFELLLASLGACTAMTVRMYANHKGWPLESVQVRLQHSLRSGEDGALSDQFDRVITLDGALSPEQRARLVEVADRCPVGKALKRGASVSVAENDSSNFQPDEIQAS